MKETKNIWRTGKTAALLLLAVLLACAVIVPASAEDSSAVFTPQEIQGMMTAGSVFSDVFDDALYNSLDDSAKADYMATVLGSLSGPSGSAAVTMNSVPGLPSANGNQQAQVQYQTRTNSILQQHDLSAYSAPLINRESIYYDADAKTFTFRYSNGVLAAVKIGRDTCCDEGNQTSSLVEAKNVFRSTEQNIDRSVSFYNALLVYDLGNTEESIGTLRDILHPLLNSDPMYTCTFDKHPSVTDYKTILKNQKLVVISAHGTMYTVSETPLTKIPALSVQEPVTGSTLIKYRADLTAQRVGLFYAEGDITQEREIFAILPQFFEHYYGSTSQQLSDAYVHLGICSGFGDGGNENYALGNALRTVGADVVTGYNNPVNVPYDHSIILKIVRELLKGDTVHQAIAEAQAEFGYTDANGESKTTAGYLVSLGNTNWCSP